MSHLRPAPRVPAAARAALVILALGLAGCAPGRRRGDGRTAAEYARRSPDAFRIHLTLLNAALGGARPLFDRYGVEAVCVGAAARGAQVGRSHRDAPPRRPSVRGMPQRDRDASDAVLERVEPYRLPLVPLYACRPSGAGLEVRETGASAAVVALDEPRWVTPRMARASLQISFEGSALRVGLSCILDRTEEDDWVLGNCRCSGTAYGPDPCLDLW